MTYLQRRIRAKKLAEFIKGDITLSAGMTLRDVEKFYVLEIFQKCDGDFSRACLILDISISQLSWRMKKWED